MESIMVIKNKNREKLFTQYMVKIKNNRANGENINDMPKNYIQLAAENNFGFLRQTSLYMVFFTEASIFFRIRLKKLLKELYFALWPVRKWSMGGQ